MEERQHAVAIVLGLLMVLAAVACETPRSSGASGPVRPSHAPSNLGGPASDAHPSPPAPGATASSTLVNKPAPAPDLGAFGGADKAYPWPRNNRYEPLSQRLAAPRGAQRIELSPGSYGHWLRHLPVRPAGTPVLTYSGRTVLEGDDPRLAAVIDLDLIGADLQQCADTIMRLRAEYLRARGESDRIGFHFVSGYHARWSDYQRGTRVRLVDDGRRVEAYLGARPDDSRKAFTIYLRDLFSYASTVSLARDAVVQERVAVGDFFILPGGPGHTVLVVDLARGHDGSLWALLAQGFMPAQDLQVLRASRASPWYRLVPGESVDTPMWVPFPWDSLRRLP